MKQSGKHILFVCTEDWFFRSHFLPLIKAAKRIEGARISLATTMGEKYEDIGRLGVEIIPLDFERASLSPLSAARVILRVMLMLRRERPDLIHFIALKPIILGGLAALAAPGRSASVYHLTGQGVSALDETGSLRRMHAVFMWLLGRFLRFPKSWLLVENLDDGAMPGVSPQKLAEQSTVLGGAGVDAELFPARPMPDNTPPRAAFVGRMVWSKGVDVLIEAMDILKERGVLLQLDLYGDPDEDNPRAIATERLEDWSGRDDVTWRGRSDDIADVWQKTDIAVTPSRGGEGMPRAMLEAASCARPLIVTDVPGCRHFVRDGVEGIIVPPEDPKALADAMERLAGDGELRRKMGEAARRRVLEGYTEKHVIDAVAGVYEKLLGQ